MEGPHFPTQQGICPKSGCSSEKSSLRGVHPGDFPSRQGENERRPISCAHSSWIKRSTLLCRKMTRVHPVVSFALLITLSPFFPQETGSMVKPENLEFD